MGGRPVSVSFASLVLRDTGSASAGLEDGIERTGPRRERIHNCFARTRKDDASTDSRRRHSRREEQAKRGPAPNRGRNDRETRHVPRSSGRLGPGSRIARESPKHRALRFQRRFASRRCKNLLKLIQDQMRNRGGSSRQCNRSQRRLAGSGRGAGHARDIIFPRRNAFLLGATNEQ